MKKYLSILKHSLLFDGVSADDLESMLACLSARPAQYRKNEFIFRSGEHVSEIGLVLSGSVHLITEDFWGNQTILAMSSPGQLFGEAFGLMRTEPLSVSVLAAEDADILFLDIRKIMTVCSSSCGHHARLIRSLFAVIVEKNLLLTKKLEHLAQRTTREKLLSYLSAESQRHGSASFEIPFNRQQLADYLCVDRSAMSGELCRLRDQGILTFRKNSFLLKEQRE